MKNAANLIVLILFSVFAFGGCSSSDKREIKDFGPVSDGGKSGIYEAIYPDDLSGKSILMIVDFRFNDMETFYPKYRMIEEGHRVTVASIYGGDIQGYGGHIIKNTYPITSVDVMSFDALYLPGGQAPAVLRENKNIINAVRKFSETERPISAVCHGPQILISAGLAQDRSMTAFPEIYKEIIKAGGMFLDEAVVIDEHIITSRLPKDLPLNVKAFLEMI